MDILFFCGTVVVRPKFPYRGKDMIFWIFPVVHGRPLSRDLHVSLANWHGFGFEFHLRSSPSAFSGYG